MVKASAEAGEITSPCVAKDRHNRTIPKYATRKDTTSGTEQSLCGARGKSPDLVAAQDNTKADNETISGSQTIFRSKQNFMATWNWSKHVANLALGACFLVSNRN